jgi:hypothetical protein
MPKKSEKKTTASAKMRGLNHPPPHIPPLRFLESILVDNEKRKKETTASPSDHPRTNSSAHHRMLTPALEAKVQTRAKIC